MNAFYGAYAGAAFTLLGLWWVALEVGRAEWISHAARRRVAGHVTFSLLITGFMSLVSLVEGPPVVWRASFVVGGVLGLANVAPLYRSGDRFLSHVAPPWVVLSATVLYLAVIVVAFLPTRLVGSEPGVTARLVGAVLFALLLMVIAWIAWSMFAYDPKRAERAAGPTES